LLVGVDLLVGEELAHSSLPDGSPTRVVPPPISAIGFAGLLQPAQHHDRHEVADVKTLRRAIESDIAGDGAGDGERIEALGVGKLMDEAALGQCAQEIGLVCGHDGGIRRRLCGGAGWDALPRRLSSRMTHAGKRRKWQKWRLSSGSSPTIPARPWT
jgi:hypothetical protein